MNNLDGKMVDGGERISYGEGAAIREPSTGKGRYDLITPFGNMRLAKWYELGGKKYSPRNWEKGMPFSRYIDSAKRHIDKYIMGLEDEDHLAAAVWNLMCIMHHEELGQTEFDDMPHYLSNNKQETESPESYICPMCHEPIGFDPVIVIRHLRDDHDIVLRPEDIKNFFDKGEITHE